MKQSSRAKRVSRTDAWSQRRPAAAALHARGPHACGPLILVARCAVWSRSVRILVCVVDHRPPTPYAARTRGSEINVGLADNVRLAAEELGLRVPSSSLAMRGTPFGQPTLPAESGGHRMA